MRIGGETMNKQRNDAPELKENGLPNQWLKTVGAFKYTMSWFLTQMVPDRSSPHLLNSKYRLMKSTGNTSSGIYAAEYLQ